MTPEEPFPTAAARISAPAPPPDATRLVLPSDVPLYESMGYTRVETVPGPYNQPLIRMRKGPTP